MEKKLTQGKMFGKESTRRKVTYNSLSVNPFCRIEIILRTHHKPNIRNTNISANAIQFALFVETPDAGTTVRDGITTKLAEWPSRIAVSEVG